MRIILSIFLLLTIVCFSQDDFHENPSNFCKSFLNDEKLYFGDKYALFTCTQIDSFNRLDNKLYLYGIFRDPIHEKSLGGIFIIHSFWNRNLLIFRETDTINYTAQMSTLEGPSEYYYPYRCVNDKIKIWGYKISYDDYSTKIYLLIQNANKKNLIGFKGYFRMYDGMGEPVIWGGGSNIFNFINDLYSVNSGDISLIGPVKLILYEHTREVKIKLSKLFFEKL